MYALNYTADLQLYSCSSLFTPRSLLLLVVPTLYSFLFTPHSSLATVLLIELDGCTPPIETPRMGLLECCNVVLMMEIEIEIEIETEIENELETETDAEGESRSERDAV